MVDDKYKKILKQIRKDNFNDHKENQHFRVNDFRRDEVMAVNSEARKILKEICGDRITNKANRREK